MDEGAKPFAEEAILALGRLDVATARLSISQAVAVDHKIGALADVVYLACAEIEEDDRVSTSTWNTLADAVDSPKLAAIVESSRG